MNKGMATGLSHPFMKEIFNSEYKYVWPDAKGELIGLVIEPFYDKQLAAARQDPLFYKLLALMDVIRVGKVREVTVALAESEKLFSMSHEINLIRIKAVHAALGHLQDQVVFVGGSTIFLYADQHAFEFRGTDDVV